VIASFAELQARYREAARSAFAQVRASRPGETLYAFALYTDGDCIATTAAVNTEEGLRRRLAGEHDVDADDLAYYRWSTGEWQAEGIGSAGFPPFDEMMAFLTLWEGEGKSHRAFRRRVLDAMVAALKALDGEGEFGRGAAREAITLFITITDCDEDFVVENRSARILNSREVARRFRRRYRWQLRVLARLAAWWSRWKLGE
jgi:hypothetical protein